jgi:single-stranded DNA-binding protein
VQGRFKTDKYTDKNGVENYSTKIQADKIQFLGKNEAADAIAPVTQAPAEDNSDVPF